MNGAFFPASVLAAGALLCALGGAAPGALGQEIPSNGTASAAGAAAGPASPPDIAPDPAEAGATSGHSGPPDGPLQRYHGDILFPYFRYDFVRHDVLAYNVISNDHRLELGQDYFAVLLEQYSFHQKATGQMLREERQFLMVRAPFNDRPTMFGEFDIGIGNVSYYGAQSQNVFSFLVNMRFAFGEHVALEVGGTAPFKQLFVNDPGVNQLPAGDFDVTMYVGMRNVMLRIGYRYLLADNTGRNGPFIGATFLY